VVANFTIANNGTGLEAQNAEALLQVSGSTVTRNGTEWTTADSGQVINLRQQRHCKQQER
jgi:hypothetical protein